MPTLHYMPLPEDADETTHAGVAFKAYEPTEVSDEVAEKLAGNPWFAAEVDEGRKDAWTTARAAPAGEQDAGEPSATEDAPTAGLSAQEPAPTESAPAQAAEAPKSE